MDLRVSYPADGVGLLELDRPHRRNALDRALLDGLPGVLRDLAADDRVRALVLTGRGGAFCAGGDLDAIAGVGVETPAEGRARMTREFATAQLLHDFRVPTVAAVDGPAVGAGLGLALACDLRIGAASSVFSSPFVRMALVPDWGVSWLLPRAVGPARATEIAVSGRKVGAEEALRIGLLDAVVADPLAEAVSRASALAAAPLAVSVATKRLVNGVGSLAEGIAGEIEAQLRAIGSVEFGRRMAEWTQAVRGR
ncbi:enoyl-CoA hydratase/isomerase family protein [Amycolatopsis jejuensis]|uniref:enoyl-CoA hydratase/isomerase family protein n=1 Tax=Amycolatopsis jejuensis TaxID=330084 RepID=UPI00052443DE|nr:enoyl-CoA hydratase/isomerase family protein [Amycolatopsis jejuensis]